MKRNIARTLALMLVLCTLLSQTAQAAVLLNRLLGRCMAGQSYENARQYPDVPQTHWAWKNICEASDGVALR